MKQLLSRAMHLIAVLFITAIVFSSCSKSDDSNPSNDSGQSDLKVKLTDLPAPYEEVNVDIREVRVKFSDDSTQSGWITLLTNAGVYNLLSLQNGMDTLLASATVQTGVLKQIRLILGTNNSIKISGAVYPLVVPSGAETGLKIMLNKAISATTETVLIDFDANLSVVAGVPGDYKLVPVLRVVY